LFYLGEYLNLFAACILLIIIFCGGWLDFSLYYIYLKKIIFFMFTSYI
jgi:NADH:ubiquinone oxidoreductase subunit H